MIAKIHKAKKEGYILFLYENKNPILERACIFLSNYEKQEDKETHFLRLSIEINGTYSGSIYPDQLIEEF